MIDEVLKGVKLAGMCIDYSVETDNEWEYIQIMTNNGSELCQVYKVDKHNTGNYYYRIDGIYADKVGGFKEFIYPDTVEETRIKINNYLWEKYKDIVLKNKLKEFIDGKILGN